MKLMNKRGQMLSALQGFVFAIVTIAVVLAMGLFILQEVSTNMQYDHDQNASTADVNSAASNATDSVIAKLGGVPTWIGILIVVVFATAVLAYFYYKN